jgi:hypothetical protein
MFGPAFMRLLGLIRRGAGLTGPMPVGRKFMRLKTAAETAAIQPLGRLFFGALRTAHRSVNRRRNFHLRRRQQTLDFCDGVMGEVLARRHWLQALAAAVPRGIRGRQDFLAPFWRYSLGPVRLGCRPCGDRTIHD